MISYIMVARAQISAATSEAKGEQDDWFEESLSSYGAAGCSAFTIGCIGGVFAHILRKTTHYKK